MFAVDILCKSVKVGIDDEMLGKTDLRRYLLCGIDHTNKLAVMCVGIKHDRHLVFFAQPKHLVGILIRAFLVKNGAFVYLHKLTALLELLMHFSKSIGNNAVVQ